MRALCLPAAVLLTLSACSNDNPLSPGETQALSAAQQRWAQRPFPDYSYQVRTMCFCSPEQTEWRVVEVRNGVVVGVRVPGDSVSLPANRLAEWPTIEELFARIRAAADNAATADVSAQYDPSLGFPVQIVIEESEHIADGGAQIEARAMTALP